MVKFSQTMYNRKLQRIDVVELVRFLEMGTINGLTIVKKYICQLDLILDALFKGTSR